MELFYALDSFLLGAHGATWGWHGAADLFARATPARPSWPRRVITSAERTHRVQSTVINKGRTERHPDGPTEE